MSYPKGVRPYLISTGIGVMIPSPIISVPPTVMVPPTVTALESNRGPLLVPAIVTGSDLDNIIVRILLYTKMIPLNVVNFFLNSDNLNDFRMKAGQHSLISTDIKLTRRCDGRIFLL